MRKFLFTLVLLSFSIVFYAQDLYDLGVVKDIRLTFKQDNWAAILDHYKEDGKDKRLKATVIMVVFDTKEIAPISMFEKRGLQSCHLILK
jgi:spore coat protein CotH